MKKQLVILGIIAILVTVELSGCSTQNNNENQGNNTLDPERNKFVGTWKLTNATGITYIYNFFSDGTYSVVNTNINGTYDIKDGKLTLIISGKLPGVATYGYNFSNSDKTLTLTPPLGTSGGEILVFTKQ